MKILISKDFSSVMLKQPQLEIITFIEYIEKLNKYNKTELLSLDSIINLSPAEKKEKIYAYSIPDDYYVIFTFTNKNDMLIIDRIQYSNGRMTSLMRPEVEDT